MSKRNVGKQTSLPQKVRALRVPAVRLAEELTASTAFPAFNAVVEAAKEKICNFRESMIYVQAMMPGEKFNIIVYPAQEFIGIKTNVQRATALAVTVDGSPGDTASLRQYIYEELLDKTSLAEVSVFAKALKMRIRLHGTYISPDSVYANHYGTGIFVHTAYYVKGRHGTKDYSEEMLPMSEFHTVVPEDIRVGCFVEPSLYTALRKVKNILSDNIRINDTKGAKYNPEPVGFMLRPADIGSSYTEGLKYFLIEDKDKTKKEAAIYVPGLFEKQDLMTVIHEDFLGWFSPENVMRVCYENGIDMCCINTEKITEVVNKILVKVHAHLRDKYGKKHGIFNSTARLCALDTSGQLWFETPHKMVTSYFVDGTL